MAPHATFDFRRAPQAVGEGHVRVVRWSRRIGIVLIVLVVLIAAVAVPAGLIAASVASRASLAKQDLEAAEKAITALDLEEAVRRVDSASAELTSARKSLQPLLPLAGLPYVGARISSADDLLAGGEHASESLSAVLASVRDVVRTLGEAESVSALLSGTLPEDSTLFKDLTPQRKRDILAALSELGPKLRISIASLDDAIAAVDDAAAEQISGEFGGQLVAVRARLSNLRAKFAAAVPLTDILPSSLGYPAAKRYLLFFENSTELRPTGGFLGIVGLLTIKDGELAQTDIRDVYYYDGPSDQLPRPEPPEPIRKYIGIDKWFLRDANWSPDFGSASRTMEKFFREEDGVIVGAANVPTIDGVIAFTPKPAQDLLRLLGPVTVDGVTFDADNLVDALEFQVELRFAEQGVPVAARKEIVGHLVQEVLRRLTSLPFSELRKVIAIGIRNLDERHVLLSVKDPALQSLVLGSDWGGTFRTAEGDALMVVDANLASLKTDPTVSRTVRYSVIPDGSGYVGDVKIEYRHSGHFDWKTTRYRTYTRVYAPAGSTFLGVTGAMEDDKLHDPRRTPGRADIAEESGRASFGAFISVEPGETRTLEFRYRLPAAIARQIQGGSYVLDVEKQSGTPGSGLTLDLDFGKKLRSAVPGENPRDYGNSRYQYVTDLRVDRYFEVTF